MVGGTGGSEGGKIQTGRRILCVGAILALIGALAIGILMVSEPERHDPFTEFYLLERAGASGSSPREYVLHEPQELTIGVGNHEFQDERYVLEIFLVEEQFDPETNATRIAAMDLLERYPINLSHDEVREFVYRFGIDSPDYNKIELLLHKDGVPSGNVRTEDRINASYRDLHLWIDVVT
ncbi:MAG: DUF1616 domain-containing protein [Methanomicrobiaceae archaeon]|nr:DUF1616 domain-containing protein [Methanomicrobiaceae archaeon]